MGGSTPVHVRRWKSRGYHGSLSSHHTVSEFMLLDTEPSQQPFPNFVFWRKAELTGVYSVKIHIFYTVYHAHSLLVIFMFFLTLNRGTVSYWAIHKWTAQDLRTLLLRLVPLLIEMSLVPHKKISNCLISTQSSTTAVKTPLLAVMQHLVYGSGRWDRELLKPLLIGL